MPAEDGKGPKVPFPGLGSDSQRGAAPSLEEDDDTSGGTSEDVTGEDEQHGSALEDLQRRADEAARSAAQAKKDYSNLQPEYTRATQERERFRQEAQALQQRNEQLQAALEAYKRSPQYETDEGGELTSTLGREVQTMGKQLQQAMQVINQQQEDMRVLAQSTMRALKNDQQVEVTKRNDSIRQKVRAAFGSFEPQVEDFLVQEWQSGDPERILELSKIAKQATLEQASRETRSNTQRQNEVASPDVGTRTRSPRSQEIDYKAILKRNSSREDVLSDIFSQRLQQLKRQRNS